MKPNRPQANLVIFFILLLILPLVTTLLPKKEFSDNENRYLQQFPVPAPTNVMNKTFMDDFESFFSDHFVLREQWIQLKNWMELVLNKKEINGVYLTKKRLIEHQVIKDNQLAEQNMQAMNTFVSKYKLPAYLMVVPTAEGIYSESLPSNAPHLNQKSIIDGIYAKADSKVQCIDVFATLFSAKKQYIYYNTDHHWTSLGAYNGYFSSAEAMGFTAKNLEHYNVEHASHEFQGTLYSKTLYDGYEKDVIDLYHLSTGELPVTVTVKSGSKETPYNSIFFREYLEKKDKYCTYTGQNEPCVTIKTGLENEKKLLVIKDSYAHSMMQFYVNHYSEITMIDLRYFTKLEQYINMEDYDQVLFVYNFASMTGDSNIKKLEQF